MSDVKKEILFQNSMTLDKRAQDFAYLRKQCFKSGTKGLYPSVDFEAESPDQTTIGTKDIMDIIGSEELTFDIKVIVDDSGTTRFYNLGSNSESNTALSAIEFVCGAMGDDGVHICADNGQVYKVQHVNSNTTSQGTFTDAEPDIAGFDGLYYWWLSANEIYRQIGSAVPTVAFNNLGINPLFHGYYNDQMVIFGQEGNDVIVLFWDKSDADLFDKRILIKNARLIAGGVIDGRVILVKGVGNGSNPKEFKGRMVVTAYDGEKFVEINSIKAGDNELDYEDITGCDVGSDRMVFSVTSNVDSANTDLYKDYIFEVRADGAIEVVTDPEIATYGDVNVVRLFYDSIVYATRGLGAQNPIIMRNRSTNDDYDDYENYTRTEYITNFLNEPYNFHKLDGFAVAFEKLFEQTDTEADPVTGEELDVYYRVSERDQFTLLMNVTVEKVKDNVNANRDQSVEYASDILGLPEQRYMITQMPDESPLPEFNEIQFKFVSKRGFSIIGAWYEYSYLSRNTLM